MNSVIGSRASWLASLPEPQRETFLESLSWEELESVLYDWREWWARPDQLAPGTPGASNDRTEYLGWLINAGRGYGKTRTGSEHVRDKVRSGDWRRVALIAPTPADARDVMVEGESGILEVCPPDFKPLWEPSRGKLTFPNGATARTYSGYKPGKLRGPQHDGAWADELAIWQYAEEAWDNLMFGLRLGENPQVVITTTPRPTKMMRQLFADPDIVITGGSTYDNLANLAPRMAQRILKKYEGTRLGLQELYGRLLEDVAGALWSRQRLDELRIKPVHLQDGTLKLPVELKRAVVAIDPASTSGEDADDTGIIVAGLGEDDECYVYADWTCHEPPNGWGKRAVMAALENGADRIIGEDNNGGEMVEFTIRTVMKAMGVKGLKVKRIHASRGKRVRAEPVSALYDQGRVHHVGELAKLEDQMVVFMPEGSDSEDDRVDAMVYAVTELMLGGGADISIGPMSTGTRDSKWQ